MSAQLREQLDRVIGDGPEHRPVEERLVAGRRALARRRGAQAVATLVVVALGGTAWSLLPGDQATARQPEYATDPSPAAGPTPGATTIPWEDDTPVRYVGGELELRPGVVVHEHLENPYGYAPPQVSDALDLTFRGQRQWVIVDGRGDTYGYSASVPSEGWESFEAYVADQVEASRLGEAWRDALRLDDQGAVVAGAGSEVLQRTDDPRFGPAYASAGTPTGAALVTAADGETYFVAWRVVDGELDTTAMVPFIGATFAESLTYARSRLSEGKALR